jgi:dolichol-phosphate mannosyltransferase
LSTETPVAVSIVVPVRNEAGNITPLITEIAAALDGRWPYEIIYVNDGSTDDTAQRLAEEMARRPNLRVLRHETSAGQSAAVRSGIRAAHGAVVATLDGDGQNRPFFPTSSLRSTRAARASVSSPGSGSAARTPASRSCSRGSPTRSATRC